MKDDGSPARVAIATMTLVRDGGEERLLRRSMEALAGAGYPVFVSDGGSGQEFVAFLQALRGVTVVPPSSAGLVGQMRASMAAAAATGAGFVVYTESDKEKFFQAGLRTFTGSLHVADPPGLVLASRSNAAFKTFPRTEQITEAAVNDLYERFFGSRGDYSYGPFALRADLVRFVEHAADDLGWGWRHFIFAIAHRLGHGVVHQSDDYSCPADQQGEDQHERLHRVRQLWQNVRGLEAGLVTAL
jgi:hypothetical protein